MYHTLCSVVPLPDFRLQLTYSDGHTRIAEFASVIAQGGVFTPLADPALFALAAQDARGRVVSWPGDIEFCADALYE